VSRLRGIRVQREEAFVVSIASSTPREGQLWWPRPHGLDAATLGVIAGALAAEPRVAQASLVTCRAFGQPNSTHLLLDLRVDWPAIRPWWQPGALRLVGVWAECLALARSLTRRLVGVGPLRVAVACGPVRVMPIAWEFLWRDDASQRLSWSRLQPALAQPEAIIYRRHGQRLG
jgi:hypothetical protein